MTSKPARARLAGAALVLLAGLAGGTGTATADPFEACARATGAEARLKACSEVIAAAGYSAEQKAVAYRNRGRTRVEAGALEQALADLAEAIRLAPADSQAFGYRAQARARLGDGDGAIADWGEVIRLRPNAALGYNGRGHALLVKGRAAEAVEDFSRAVAISPGSASALNNRGLAHRAAGNLERAIADYTAAIQLNPIYALAYNNRGYALEAMGRKDEAIADFRRALMVDPALTGAKQGLVRLGAMGTLAEESQRLVAEGKALVERHCQACHAVGADGASPNAKAPAFRTLHARHPMQALREPLTRGIAAPHDEMPKFRLPDTDIDKIVAYINSLEGQR